MVSDPGHAFSISGVLFNKAVVMIDQFWTVAGSIKATKNNSYDSEARLSLFYLASIVQSSIMERCILYRIIVNNQ